jgi:hypothetical protein
MKNKSFLNYRPEIDGLGSLAVIEVVLCHAKFLIYGLDFLVAFF